ncbi:hypothetical protein BOSEA1005_30229 [Hyphomicrobiales bacterium]|nr:hypothetical protein BOSEA1005_30229 [Hyphomicrobiales bacterium]
MPLVRITIAGRDRLVFFRPECGQHKAKRLFLRQRDLQIVASIDDCGSAGDQTFELWNWLQIEDGLRSLDPGHQRTRRIELQDAIRVLDLDLENRQSRLLPIARGGVDVKRHFVLQRFLARLLSGGLDVESPVLFGAAGDARQSEARSIELIGYPKWRRGCGFGRETNLQRWGGWHHELRPRLRRS